MFFDDSKTISKPWGHEVIWAHTDTYVGKYLYICANSRLSKQFHVEKEETISVLSGVLRLEVGNEDVQVSYLMPGDSYHIKPKTVHRFCAENTSVHLVEVSTPQLHDVVRISDDYNRKES